MDEELNAHGKDNGKNKSFIQLLITWHPICGLSITHKEIMKRRILVIEDDDLVRDTVQLLLEYKGFEVRTSATGTDAYTLVQFFKPDLILTDIFLGKVDGRIICRQIKNNPLTSHIPVLIMSGADDIYNTISDAGANDIVLKPFDEQTLISRVQRQLTA